MTKTAWVFPGQGSQSVGMCRDLYDGVKSARDVFEAADKALGFPLTGLCFEGPVEELRQTINAQPALVTAGYACVEAMKELKGSVYNEPIFLAGHSLGEYTALIVADVIDFTTAVRLARERGRLMHEAGQKRAGSMSAILGLDEAKVAVICWKTDVIMANINCPGQVVISGAKENVVKANEMAIDAGANRAIVLQVSGAFHSPLMKSAAEGLAKYIDATAFKTPKIPVIGNVTGLPLTTPEEVKTELKKQLLNPVLWQRSIEYMIRQGVTGFLEIGPGKVLTGLIKRINNNVDLHNLNSYNTIATIEPGTI